MSEATATVSTEQKPVIKKARKPRPEDNSFSMSFWEDERLARKFIKENLLFISQKAADDGIKSHFGNRKDENGLAVMEVQFADPREETLKDGSKRTIIEFTGNNYIRVTFDPNRKFPKSSKEEGGEKKKSSIPTFVKRA